MLETLKEKPVQPDEDCPELTGTTQPVSENYDDERRKQVTMFYG